MATHSCWFKAWLVINTRISFPYNPYSAKKYDSCIKNVNIVIGAQTLGQINCIWCHLVGKHDSGAKFGSRAKIDSGGGGHHPLHLARVPDVALIRVKRSQPLIKDPCECTTWKSNIKGIFNRLCALKSTICFRNPQT